MNLGNQSMGLHPGQVLQNQQYTIERRLGKGRFSYTYLSRRPNGERWVLKAINSQILASLSAVERDRLESMFWKEAVTLAKCSGTSHIVKVEQPFKEDGIAYVPMEYVDGNSLKERAQTILPENTALEYIRQISEALIVVHEQGIVHRDIRPDNIFRRIQNIDKKIEAVLTGFELAVRCDAALTRTRKGEIIDGFSPIELYSRGQPIGPYTDVYSLAATLYELLTGEIPISAEDRKINGIDLISPQVKNPDISGKTAKAILLGMQLLPEKRPQSVFDWLSTLGIENKRMTESSQSSVNWSKWQTVVAAVAVLVTLLVGTPAWLSWYRSDSKPVPEKQSEIQGSGDSSNDFPDGKRE